MSSTSYAIFSKPDQKITFKYKTDIQNNLLVSSGSVGIGTATPSAPLQVVGSVRADNYTGPLATIDTVNANTGTIQMLNSSNITMQSLNATSANVGTLTSTGTVSGTRFIASDGVALRSTNPILMRLQAELGADLDITTGNFQRMVIKNGGSVGILQSNPQSGLHVGGITTFDTDVYIKDSSMLEFGRGVVGKESSAGVVGYKTFSTDSLDIVGAGESNGTRKIKLYENVSVEKDLTAINGETSLNLVNAKNRPIIKHGTLNQIKGKLFTFTGPDVNSLDTVSNPYGGTLGITYNVNDTPQTISIASNTAVTNIMNGASVIGLYHNTGTLFNSVTSTYGVRSVRYQLNEGVHNIKMGVFEWYDEIPIDGVSKAIIEITAKCDDELCLYMNGAPILYTTNNSDRVRLALTQKQMDFQCLLLNRMSGTTTTAVEMFVDYRIIYSW